MFRTNCWYDTQCIKGSNSLNFLFTHALSLELAVIAGTSQQRAALTITYACLCQLVEDELLLACISHICYCQTALSEYCINQNTNWEVILSFGDFFQRKRVVLFGIDANTIPYMRVSLRNSLIALFSSSMGYFLFTSKIVI